MTAERRTYAYRLDVTYPEGSNERGWEPKDWDGWADEVAGDLDASSIYFQWPSVKTYLSQSTAKRRADLLRKYGATVTIIRSEPIVWPA